MIPKVILRLHRHTNKRQYRKSSSSESLITNENQSQQLRRSTRSSNPPGEWWKSLPSNSSEEPSNLALFACDAPSSYSDATSPANIDFWKSAILKEENSIRENNTFTLVVRKSNMHVLPCRYVFKVKKDVGPKVRIVAKGFRQIHGVDYNETYAPVVSLTALRCFLATIASLDLECDQMDVVTAFLNGDLDEDIYMEVPAGFKDPTQPNVVCKLQKALYGLKQAPRQWYAKINKFLLEDLNFTCCPHEPCLYYKHDGKSIAMLVLYVDDLLIAGDNRSQLDSIKLEFSRRFKMKNLGVASEFLGIKISRNRSDRTLHLSQAEYANTVLERFGMQDSKPIHTPMEPSALKSTNRAHESTELAGEVPYRQAIGSLMYLMISTRPDIAYAVGIMYGNLTPTSSIGYSDSDWAGCVETRKSTEGFVFLLSGGAVSWRSKKQTVVATSSCEAEYISVCSATKEAIWLSQLISCLQGHKLPTPMTILVDNQGAIASAHNWSINARNKHIGIRYHFVREAVANNQVKISYCSASDQLADPLTKPLNRILQEKLCSRMGLQICSVPRN
eukprot:IDg22843t1